MGEIRLKALTMNHRSLPSQHPALADSWRHMRYVLIGNWLCGLRRLIILIVVLFTGFLKS
jgi:hypothetical protein